MTYIFSTMLPTYNSSLIELLKSKFLPKLWKGNPGFFYYATQNSSSFCSLVDFKAISIYLLQQYLTSGTKIRMFTTTPVTDYNKLSGLHKHMLNII